MHNKMKDKTTHANVNLQYAVELVYATCCLAGSASYLDDIRADLRECGVIRAIKAHDTAAVFDWLVAGAIAVGRPPDLAKRGISMGFSTNRDTMDEAKARSMTLCKNS
ncbi:MAG: hypothetical protein WBX95_16630, partial [Xanthobacteraceae bacterium]